MRQDPFLSLPLVKAGFESPATDYLEPRLDYNDLFNSHRPSVFSLRVDGQCMRDAHLPHNSILVIDRSIKPRNNSIIVGVLNGERVLKHIVTTLDGTFLLPANEDYPSIKLEEYMDFKVWGTVTHGIIEIVKTKK